MKTAMSFLIAGALVATASTTNAQQIGNYAASVNPVYSKFTAPENSVSLNASEVNANALSHFTATNKSATNAVWTANGNVQSVYFTKNEVKTRSTYNEKGKLEYTLRYFTPQQAPQQIRDLVRNDYSHMSLLQVTEVERRGSKYHLVKMEDKQTILTIQLLNGETDIFEKITK